MAGKITNKVLVILFPGFNTLDMNGPYEVLRMSSDSGLFVVTVAAEADITTSFEGVHVQRDIPLDETLTRNLGDYSVLVVPGGPLAQVELQASKITGNFMNCIRTFERSEVRSISGPRILLSICTGSFFLAALGIFNGRYCTTHWANRRQMELVNQKSASGSSTCGKMLPARFVDSGVNPRGIRIISSGGVSCGLDASLYVVQLFADENTARKTAELLDYYWRKTEGFVLGDDKRLVKLGDSSQSMSLGPQA